ncbi:hypothetical protein COW36_17655 [bacterium (Candidatus Blackallbacteria) CG17_big_fil_post_rev_8_21_14_2_50_48_46]|uniref:Uncharacterized protein n=1 Tax=bacterium (Candidatus Blackallbacteria) CG17_big_fil_post_rev_8_21_14_2_50_48_46 TaxID=2014261 RepID=A0A2M7G0J8_9BACT|nr:MAG: hypothetical protein COW64_01070 [bacterium (Candidatus Blackallbacteria) CG18_big_fil_WC_8_21_14_2_50_49_26]PIW15245.1 MAG: hypothetical protein COW36_17655 [bacterium (Candidatus Blackallbacteria) CG17_big_fil_post_rev_8_21_14_2_50_48_46]PIW45246.1 MAG: hypothetical protein COW20_21360 [bacterium (Candidatus Blackallbacteria) CG13_big_fil_rev_8_21_14_2_50_49_14]
MYQKRTAVTLLGTAVILIFFSVSCQPSQPAASPSEPPSASATAVQPSPSASAAGMLSNVKLCPACHGEYTVVAGDKTCPAEPVNCPAADPRVRPLPPQAIDEAKFESLQKEWGLTGLRTPPESLGGLKPALALAQGQKFQCESGNGLAMIGGLGGFCKILLTEQGGKTVQINTPEAFRKIFAPVESTEEALAFATALTTATPLYEFDKRAMSSRDFGMIDLRPEFRYFSTSFVPTTVVKEGENYRVNLFDFQQFGCGPHPHYAVSYRVSSAGEVSEISRVKLFEDPNLDGLCVD